MIRNVSLALALSLALSPAIALAQFEGEVPAPVREDPRKSTQARAPSDVGFFAWLFGTVPDKKDAKAEEGEGKKEAGAGGH